MEDVGLVSTMKRVGSCESTKSSKENSLTRKCIYMVHFFNRDWKGFCGSSVTLNQSGGTRLGKLITSLEILVANLSAQI